VSGLLYVFYTAANLALLFWGLSLWRRYRLVSTLLIAAVIFGLVYDNLILSAGVRMQAGPLLYGLSLPRFILHQLILPWLILAAFDQARRAGIGWATGSRGRTVAIVAAAAVMVAGVLTRIVGVTWEPALMDGVTRYVAVGVAGPPLVSIVSIGFATVVGFFLWRKLGWPWIALAGVLVFIGEGIPVEAVKRVLGSGAEVLFMAAMLQLDRRQGEERR
jgi:hypothetical protein